MTTGSKQLQRRRLRLCREQDWFCYFCGQLMLKPIKNPNRGLQHPQNEATLEHLDDRFNPERGTRAGEIRTVAACRKCNQERGAISEAGQPIEELRKRAKH